MAEKRYWFKNKHYGWGWYPATWEGWVVMAAWLAVFLFILKDVERKAQSASGVLLGIELPAFLSVIALIAISYATGEKPEWRWGGKPVAKKHETDEKRIDTETK